LRSNDQFSPGVTGFAAGSIPQSPYSSQSAPSSSIGCCVRMEPCPHPGESAMQYLSHPQQTPSGYKGNFFAMSRGPV